LNLDYPAYAYGVYREGELVLIIFLWHANIDQRTLYYVNLFKILCDLAQMSLLRAYDYSIAMYEKQYIPNTHIMNSQYFEECFENYLALSAKKVMSFVILEIDVNGAMQVKKKYPDAVLIMLLPPTFSIQEERLRGRATEDEETIQKRLAQTKAEVPHFAEYDYIVYNYDGCADKAAGDILAIVRAEQLSSKRNPKTADLYFAK
jgi:hypothetical protein